MNRSNILYFTAATALMAISSGCFFGLCYPHHLHYQEQYQMFLDTADYAYDVVMMPGGLADYCGRWLTQFFCFSTIAAIIMGLLLALAQWLTWICIGRKSDTSRPLRFILSFLPSLALWIFFCDENAIPGTLIAFIFSLSASAGVLSIGQDHVRWAVATLLSPLLYWAAGPMAWLGISLCCLHEASRRQWLPIITMLVGSILSLAWARHVCSAHSINFFYGIHYYRYPLQHPMLPWIAASLVLLVRVLPLPRRHAPSWCVWTSALALCGVYATTIHASYNAQAENVMAYDFMCRNQQWNRIMMTADRTNPRNSISLTALNLALCKSGRMADHLFDYFQHGTDGLLPPFVSDPLSPLTTSEAFYHIGMVNTAQRFVFEAQEAIPDYQKSARCYKRLAETNLINGAYDVARKYLVTLQHTLFYRQWATKTLAMLDDEESIGRHPEYGWLRQNRHQEDFIFSDQEMPAMLARLMLVNPQNRIAFEYLMAWQQLSCNVDAFANFYQLGSRLAYPAIPTSYQQTLITWWSRNHTPSEPLPAELRHDLFMQFDQFVALSRQESDRQRLKSQFGHTFWYYYLSNQ